MPQHTLCWLHLTSALRQPQAALTASYQVCAASACVDGSARQVWGRRAVGRQGTACGTSCDKRHLCDDDGCFALTVLFQQAQKSWRTCCNQMATLNPTCAFLLVVLLFSSRADGSLTCPTTSAATSCYQGVIGATPLVQSILWSGFLYADTSYTSSEYGYNQATQTYSMLYNVVPSKINRTGYFWNAPSSGTVAFAGGVVTTPTGTTNGVCASATVTCAQLLNYVSLVETQLPSAADWALACPAGNAISIFIGVPNVTACTRILAFGQNSKSPLASSLLGTLAVTTCTTTNCNTPPTPVPVVAAPPISCPASNSATATSCYFGVTGAASATLQNFLYNGYTATLKPGLQQKFGWSAPALSTAQFSGSVATVTLSNSNSGGGVCASVTVLCEVLFSYAMAFIGQGGALYTALQWSQMCPTGTSVTAYVGATRTICTSATALNASLYGLPLVTCGTTNCNAVTPAPVVAPPPFVPVVRVTSTVTGYTTVTFDVVAQNAFISATASVLNVSVAAVAITAVTSAPSGRHLMVNSINVQYTVSTTLPATNLTTALGSTAAFNNALGLAFGAANRPIPAITSSAATQLVAAPPPSPRPPPPPSPPPPTPPSSPPPPRPPPGTLQTPTPASGTPTSTTPTSSGAFVKSMTCTVAAAVVALLS